MMAAINTDGTDTTYCSYDQEHYIIYACGKKFTDTVTSIENPCEQRKGPILKPLKQIARERSQLARLIIPSSQDRPKLNLAVPKMAIKHGRQPIWTGRNFKKANS